MRKIYFLVSTLLISLFSMAQVALPLDFESNSITYTFTDFDGGGTTKIANPQSSGINTSANVAKMVKSAGQTWGGSFISLASPIDFSTNKTFKMKVYSPRVGAKVLLKVENQSNGAINFEKSATTTVANAWEELTFDYNLISTSNQYQKLVFIFELGTMGDGSANFTFLFDDVKLVSSGGAALTAPVLPLDFESSTIDYTWTDFDGGATTRIDNPQKTGINTSNKVAKMVKSAGQPWGGSWMALANPIDFSVNKVFKMKVYSPRVGAKVLLKVENAINGAQFLEIQTAATVANAWEELTFDMSAINTANTYQKIAVIYDLGTMGDGSANFTIMFDDLRQTAGSGGGLTQMNLPVTFDLNTVDYGLIGFEGAEASSIVVDPTNAGNKVAKVIKSATAQPWAGTTVSAPGGLGFSSKIPFSASDKKMNVRVWSPNAGIQVRLKVEDHADPTKSVETEATVTVAAGWQTLEFNFANQATGTSPINLAYNYDKASIFFNFGVNGATAGEKTYYFDDVQFGASILPVSLLDFKVSNTANGVALAWATSTESNNKGFAVERSRDGQRWAEIAFVNSKGNSTNVQSYTTTDATPEKGMNYYRLKQMDLDGKVTYSMVRVVNLNGKGSLSIYPNPAKGRVNVSLTDMTGKTTYNIYNMSGKGVLAGTINNVNGIGTIDVSALPAGTYMIRVVGENNTVSDKLILL